MTKRSTGLFLALAAGLIATAGGSGCSSGSGRQVFDDPFPDAALAAPGEGPEAGELFADAAPPEDLSPNAKFTGKVLTPKGDIPIAGALVYLVQQKPDPMPDANYCDSCVKLDKTVPEVLTKTDGTFEIVANRVGKQFLVIQKGQFRRVIEVDVKAGTDVVVSRADGLLPTATDAAKGDHVPSVLVIDTTYDDIEETLDKLGMSSQKELQSGRLSFLRDPAKLAKYQIIFLPCGTCGTVGGSNFIGNDNALDPVLQANLKDWVQKGGRLYVTDFAYSFMNETWKNYVTFAPNRGCDTSAYDTPAKIEDVGLKDWLAGQGHTNFQFEEAWLKIDYVNEVDVPDGAGGTKKYTPKIWAYGQDGSRNRPMTLSFEDGCGRVLYSAYHSEGDPSASTTLLPQEKALMYVLFEVTTCIVDPVIPK